MPLFAIIFGNMTNSFSPFNTGDETVKLAAENSLKLLYVGIAAYFSSLFSFSLFMITGE